MIVELDNGSVLDISYASSCSLEDTKYPAILFLHGFLSNKDEVCGMYKNLSNRFIEKGAVTIRFNFKSCSSENCKKIDSTVNDFASVTFFL